jgi:hypothetical protein
VAISMLLKKPPIQTANTNTRTRTSRVVPMLLRTIWKWPVSLEPESLRRVQLSLRRTRYERSCFANEGEPGGAGNDCVTLRRCSALPVYITHLATLHAACIVSHVGNVLVYSERFARDRALVHRADRRPFMVVLFFFCIIVFCVLGLLLISFLRFLLILGVQDAFGLRMSVDKLA